MRRGTLISFVAAAITVAGCNQGSRRVAVRVDPPSADVVPFATQHFQAHVSGTLGKNVTWSVTRGPGTVDAVGNYTAPDRIPRPEDNDIRVRAAAVSDSAAFFEVVVHIVEPPLNPDRGPDDGGTTVSITGSDFTGGGTVLIGGVSATYEVVNPSLISVKTPPHAGPGAVDVVLQPVGAPALTFPKAFHYAVAWLRFGGVQLSQICPEAKSFTTVDATGDGNADIFVVCSGQLQALLSDPNGNLQAPITIPLKSPPISVSHGQFDGTGGEELYIHETGVGQFADTAGPVGSNEILTFTGGSSTSLSSFKDPIGKAVQRVADVDHIGGQDLIVAGFNPAVLASLVKIAPEGGGTLSAGLPFAGGLADLATGDFNEDGDVDAAILGSAGVTIFKGNAGGAFSLMTKVGTPPFLWIAAGDVDGDNHCDVVLARTDGLMQAMLGNGAGGLGAPIPLPQPGGIAARPVIVDVDGVAPAEVVFPSNVPEQPGLVVISATSNYYVAAADTVPLDAAATASSRGPTFFCLNSGFIETHTVSSLAALQTVTGLKVFQPGHRFQTLISNSGGIFASNVPFIGETGELAYTPIAAPLATTRALLDPTASATRIVVADFDEDGLADLVGTQTSSNGSSGLPPLFASYGVSPTSPLGSGVAFASTANVMDISAGQLDDDVHEDLVLVSAETALTDRIDVLFGNGDGSFMDKPPLSIETGRRISSAVIADIDGDGHPEIVAGGRDDGTIAIYAFYGSRTPKPAITISGPVKMKKLIVADIDGDYSTDLIVLGQLSTFVTYAEIDVILGHGNETFDEPIRHTVLGFATDFDVIDADGDSFPDLVLFERQLIGSGPFLTAVLRGKRGGQFAEPDFAYAGAREGVRLILPVPGSLPVIVEPRAEALLLLPNDSQ